MYRLRFATFFVFAAVFAVALFIGTEPSLGGSSFVFATGNKQQVVATQKSYPAVKVIPLQDSKEVFHDLRAPSSYKGKTTKYASMKNYRTYNAMLVKDRPTSNPTPASTPAPLEESYNETMRLAAIGAGAPNAPSRGVAGAQPVRLVPNAADRAGKDFLKWSGDLAGQGQYNATAQNGLPRHVLTTTVEKKEAEQRAPSPYAQAGVAPSYGQQQGYQPTSYQAPPPPANYNATNNRAVTSPTSTWQTSRTPFTYQKLDQKSRMTTPRLGSPSTNNASSFQMPQANNYAMVTSSAQQPEVTAQPLPEPSSSVAPEKTSNLVWKKQNIQEAATQSPSFPDPVIYPILNEQNKG